MLKLVPPRQGKSPNYTVRGTYLGITVDRSAKTADKAIARRVLAQIKADIECGQFAGRKELTFASAALSYAQAGGERRFILPITEHFGPAKLARHIDQAAVDECAVTLYPDATPATRNRQVYTPISAILKHSHVEVKIARPKGANGRQRKEWLQPEEAERLLKAAKAIDAEFAIFLMVLLATGMRLSDGLNTDCRSVDLRHATLYIPETKNGDPRTAHLPPFAVAALASHPNGLDRRGKLFRFSKNGHLYNLLGKVKRRAGSDLSWITFHHLCHTWATWMRKYAGLDTRDLLDTGRWRDQHSAARYAHIDVTETAKKANYLPIVWKG